MYFACSTIIFSLDCGVYLREAFIWKLDAAKNCINYGINISRIKRTECFKRLNRRLIAGGAYSSKIVIYFGILTTDTVRRSENFIKGGNLCNCASYTSFKISVMRPEAMKNNRANRTEKMSSLKEKKS